MSKSLRERLVGAWQLVSYVEKNVDTGEESKPLGEKPEAIIMYTPDGYMSAQLCSPGRKNFEGGDMYLTLKNLEQCVQFYARLIATAAG